MITRLAAGRSAWNIADIRGEVEQLIAAAGIVADPSVRTELAEELTARALACCMPLLSRDGMPIPVPEQHIQAWTSQAVLDVEADLAARLAARGARDRTEIGHLARPLPVPGGLDAGQAAAVAALAGSRPLVVVRVLPADYVAEHVELAYAGTAHGIQGDTVTTAHTVIGEHTGAASAYVGMTRGRTATTAHLVAADVAEAREQWIAAFARDRADLGPAHAAGLAAAEAARYPSSRPLDDVVAELHPAWTAQQGCLDRLEREHLQRKVLSAALTRQTEDIQRLAALEDYCQQTASDAADVQQRADYIGTARRVPSHAARQGPCVLGRVSCCTSPRTRRSASSSRTSHVPHSSRSPTYGRWTPP